MAKVRKNVVKYGFIVVNLQIKSKTTLWTKNKM